MRSLYFSRKNNSIHYSLFLIPTRILLLIHPDIQNQDSIILWIINNLFLHFNSRGILIYLLQCFSSWFKTKYSNVACLLSVWPQHVFQTMLQQFQFLKFSKIFFKFNSSLTFQYKINLDPGKKIIPIWFFWHFPSQNDPGTDFQKIL